MRLTSVGPIALGAAAVLLASCAPYRDPALPAAPRARTCDVATAAATTFGAARARLYAEQALRYQIVDLRGEMLQSGLRRVRPVHRAASCATSDPAGGPSAVHQCVVKVRLCGR
jgi:hypothetical protein